MIKGVDFWAGLVTGFAIGMIVTLAGLVAWSNQPDRREIPHCPCPCPSSPHDGRDGKPCKDKVCPVHPDRPV